MNFFDQTDEMLDVKIFFKRALFAIIVLALGVIGAFGIGIIHHIAVK
jgi:hypothetical protein